MKEEHGYGTMLAAMLLSPPTDIAGPTFVPRLTREWPLTDVAAFRAELAVWLHDSWDESITVREWWGRMADAGLTMPTWPRSFGGIAAPTAMQQVVEREFASKRLIGPPVAGVGLRLVGPALRQHATPEQCDRFLQPLMRGEQSWCVLVHEHDADLSDIETVATASGSTFILTGNKVWSPEAPGARWALVLARTDTTGHKKRHHTCFAVDLAHPTVTIDDEGPRPRLVHLDGTIAQRADAIGGVAAGWTVAHTIVSHGQASLAGRIRRGVIDVAPGEAAGNLDRTVGEVLAAHRPRPRRAQRRVDPGSDRRHSADFT